MRSCHSGGFFFQRHKSYHCQQRAGGFAKLRLSLTSLRRNQRAKITFFPYEGNAAILRNRSLGEVISDDLDSRAIRALTSKYIGWNFTNPRFVKLYPMEG